MQRIVASQYLICNLQFAPDFIKQADYCSAHFSRKRYVGLVVQFLVDRLLKKITESLCSNCNRVYGFAWVELKIIGLGI